MTKGLVRIAILFGVGCSPPLSHFKPRMLLQDLDKPIRIKLDEERTYDVTFAAFSKFPGEMRNAGLRPGKCLVVTDSNVAQHYRSTMDALLKEDGWEPLILTLPAGENTKSPKHLHAIYDAALAWEIDRQTPMIALGGGVIGDLTGMAAATLLRGIPFIQVPTSLIAQVDSALGGKTGINHEEGKNLIGAFHQPRLVFVDTTLLYTLPRREWLSGLGEVIKHALIQDLTFFDWIESELDKIVARDPGVVTDMVYRAAFIKAGVVSEDELEQGKRTLLNFGHTFAHALEKAAGYGVFTHGEAVILGMKAALHMSRRFNRHLDQNRAEAVLNKIPVPPIPASLGIPAVKDAMRTDKKRDADRLNFVLLSKLGSAYVTADVNESDIDAAWAHALGRP